MIKREMGVISKLAENMNNTSREDVVKGIGIAQGIEEMINEKELGRESDDIER